MLKEVTGTQIFDQRAAKMNDVLKDAQDSKQGLQETLEAIQIRIRELEQETEEVKQMKEKESEKRAVERVIFDKKLQEVEGKLFKLREDKRELLSKRNQCINLISEAEKQEDEHLYQL